MRVEPFNVRRWCVELGGIARTVELARVGIDEYSLKRAVRSGEISRVREGVYATSDTPADVIIAVAHGGVLGCVSRLRAARLWVLEQDDDRVHVSMPRSGRRRRHDDCECVIHWSGSSPSGAVATLVDALAQVLGCLGVEDFFVALESALRKRLLDRATLERLRTRIPVMHRWLVDFARWDADSGLESLLRLRLRRIGLSLTSQVRIPGVGHVDFVLGDLLVLEVDGVPGHADSAESRHKDLVRDAVASTYGLDTLRFDYALVVHDWPLVEAAILAKVERMMHRGR
jgi:very-short-patch-repair endonuclease